MNNRAISIFYILIIFSFFRISVFAQDKDETDASMIRNSRLDTLRYGTDSEICTLIKILETEKSNDFDTELITLIKATTNPNLLEPLFRYLTIRSITGAEIAALAVIVSRDDIKPVLVDVSLEYLAKMGSSIANSDLIKILEAGETRFINEALRTLGRSGDRNISPFLIGYYSRDVDDSVKKSIIDCLGAIKAQEAVDFLLEKALEKAEKSTLRIAAISALSQILEQKALYAITGLIYDEDANLRTEVVFALAKYPNTDVDSIIVEALRDSYYKVRLAACKVCGERNIIAAIPYLQYRAERDEVISVQEAALKALGSLATEECLMIIKGIFFDKKATESSRTIAINILLKRDTPTWLWELKNILQIAKQEKRMNFYYGLAKLISEIEDPSVEQFVSYFLTSSDLVDLHYGLDIIMLNHFIGYEVYIEKLALNKNSSISIKAQKIRDLFASDTGEYLNKRDTTSSGNIDRM